MYQRARAERSEVQNLIYGGSDGNTNKNYMRQNYEELQQIQRETQQKKTQMDSKKDDRWVMKKFRDVKPKLAQTGMVNNENQKAAPKKAPEPTRSRTQDKSRINASNAPQQRKLTKAEKFKQMNQGKPLKEMSQNSREPIKRKSTL